jgi:hypothetical protein
MVNVANRTNVAMRLVPLKFRLGHVSDPFLFLACYKHVMVTRSPPWPPDAREVLAQYYRKNNGDL